MEIDAGIASPLLDLRLESSFLGDWSFAFLASPLASSEVAPPVTPMLSLAILATAGAFERQLPVPPNHFLLGFLFSVCWLDDCEDAVAFELASESARDSFVVLFRNISLPLGVFDVVLTALGAGESSDVSVLPSAGALGFGFDFLRGLIPKTALN